ncbi:sorting nexin-24 isoform X7 [Manis pentadactyla]|uniref:sorting nexin-24 isoform X7 n=1 Tax=Manis pentadactyla TaxID=143292 RepID=UPI0018750369|nr:sorting nexin-24 isoform X7 [Manis pentadactyla]
MEENILLKKGTANFMPYTKRSACSSPIKVLLNPDLLPEAPRQLKKCIKTPEIPSKHVRNWVPKVLEQRRQGLETYLQAVILENEELPKLFLDFLNVRHLPSLPKAESCGSFEETESEESSKLSHQPVLLFLRDPYVLPAASDFPNVVIEGVLHGIFYPHLQLRCYGTLHFSS